MSLKEPLDHQALNRFALGPSVQERAAAVTDLFADKVFLKVTKTKLFTQGVEGLLETFTHPATEYERLAALVELVRISQSSPKTIATEIRNRTTPLLNDPLVSVSSLKEPNDRVYIAKACGWTSATWVINYAIESMISEETAETVRHEFANILFSRAISLADIFLKLQISATSLSFETESPADTMATRLARIIAVLRTGIVSSLLPPGESPGEKLAAFIRLPFSRTGLPTKDERQLTLAREIILCTYDLVRMRFSLATDSDTYLPLKAAKRIFGGSNWPEELRVDLERVANSILEALLLLAKQGLTSQSLVEHLEIVVNHRMRSDALLRDLANGHPELSESVRAWLRKTKYSNVSGTRNTIAESRELRTDPLIGQAILESGRVAEGVSALRLHVIPAIQLYDPSLLPVIESHVVRAESLISVISDISSQRRLGIFGVVGQDIDFSPKYFDTVGGSPGLQVRVVRPAVVRLNEDGQPGEVVVRGLVESL